MDRNTVSPYFLYLLFLSPYSPVFWWFLCPRVFENAPSVCRSASRPWSVLAWLNNLSHFPWHFVFMSLVSGARVSAFISRVQGLLFCRSEAGHASCTRQRLKNLFSVQTKFECLL